MIYIYQGSSTVRKRGKKIHFFHVWLVIVATVTCTFPQAHFLCQRNSYFILCIQHLSESSFFFVVVVVVLFIFIYLFIFYFFYFLFFIFFFLSNLHIRSKFANFCHDIVQNFLS